MCPTSGPAVFLTRSAGPFRWPWRRIGSGLNPDVNLSDPNDGHVVAAARRAGAETIVTFNLKDFPADELSRYGLHAQSPNVFLTSVFDAHPEEAMDAMRRLVSSKRHPPRTMSEEIEHLRVLRLPLFARRLSETVG